MSFGYKMYANSQVGEGRYFLSKLVLKNTGGAAAPRPDCELPGARLHPLDDAGSGQPIAGPGRASWRSTAQNSPERITHLTNQTTASLEIKLQWREESAQDFLRLRRLGKRGPITFR
jgi:hypothetical protein